MLAVSLWFIQRATSTVAIHLLPNEKKIIILLIAKKIPHFVFWLHLELAIKKFIIFRKILPFSGHGGETIFFHMKLPRNHYFWSQKPHSCKIYYYAKSEQKIVYWMELLKKKNHRSKFSSATLRNIWLLISFCIIWRNLKGSNSKTRSWTILFRNRTFVHCPLLSGPFLSEF